MYEAVKYAVSANAVSNPLSNVQCDLRHSDKSKVPVSGGPADPQGPFTSKLQFVLMRYRW